MKKVIVIGIAILSMLSMCSLPVLADDSAEISVSMQIKLIAMTSDVNSWSVNSGNPLELDAEYTSAVDYVTITNTGNVPVDISASATNTSSWTMVIADAGADEFILSADENALTTSPAVIDSNLAKDGTFVFQLKCHTGTSTTSYDVETSTITISVAEAAE